MQASWCRSITPCRMDTIRPVSPSPVRRRQEILEIARREGILIVEDAPYLYINFAAADEREKPFLSLDPAQTVHLFTGSKIGFPGPRVAYLYSEAELRIADGETATLAELALVQASADILFPNPAAYRGFEALLHEADFSERQVVMAGGGRQARRVPGEPGNSAERLRGGAGCAS